MASFGLSFRDNANLACFWSSASEVVNDAGNEYSDAIVAA